MKIYIATPTLDGLVKASYASALTEVGLDCGVHNVGLVLKILKNCTFIDIARNILVKRFLETDCTHLFFIDSDLGFDGRHVRQLASVGLPFTAGVYPKREDELKFNAQFDNPQYAENPGERASWISADRVATGFMCLDRHVVETMAHDSVKMKNQGELLPMLFETRFDGGNVRTFVGEDYAFCDKYMDLYRKGVFNHPIWVWPDITFDHAGHVGNFHEQFEDDGLDEPLFGR